jgi:hypothetical protein
MPPGGLKRSMLHPEKPLTRTAVLKAAGNCNDEILHCIQRYWIAQAIRYAHVDAVCDLFENETDR